MRVGLWVLQGFNRPDLVAEEIDKLDPATDTLSIAGDSSWDRRIAFYAWDKGFRIGGVLKVRLYRRRQQRMLTMLINLLEDSEKLVIFTRGKKSAYRHWLCRASLALQKPCILVFPNATRELLY